MTIYRVREVRLADVDGGAEKVTPLREYDLTCTDERAAIEEVRHFLEVEILSLRAPQNIDFDALIVLDKSGVEVARFRVTDVWKREADAVNFGKIFPHWV